MTTRSGIETLTVSALLSAGLLALVTQTWLPDVLSTLGDSLVAGWLGVLGAASIGLGVRRRIPTVDLLGGGLLGMVVGWLAFSVVVGFDFVLLVIALLGSVGWIAGTWVAYERRRQNDAATEPPVGSWRVVFGLLAAVPLALVVIAVGV